MDSNFEVHQIYVESEKCLYRSEVESGIIKYAETNDLVLPPHFDKSHYLYFGRNDRPHTQLWLITIEFFARKRTPDDSLREQIEFQIKELER
ncbi:MAG: hypothetical protein REI96_06195 [Flavobacterium nitrogenifigens]|uniref:hypothetical protein n=1 Tax=Flavobacterium nitrogenifigens TaxID=1617283 RepID=UPI002806E36D|nr:hypothetical protein [Flavobacterium nitrogenifigens]MDQ8012017.1 hypothetical protein [Flavobacterium nitrogenifigens]